MASPPAPPTDVPLAVPPGPPAAGFVLEGCHLVAFDIRPSTLTADAASAGTRTAVTTGGMTKSGAAAARPPGLELTKAAVTALTAVNAGSTLAAHGNGSTGGTTDCASGAAGVDDEEAAATGAAGAAGAAGPADATLGSASGDTAPSGTGDDGGRPAVAAGAAGAGASAAQAAGGGAVSDGAAAAGRDDACAAAAAGTAAGAAGLAGPAGGGAVSDVGSVSLPGQPPSVFAKCPYRHPQSARCAQPAGHLCPRVGPARRAPEPRPTPPCPRAAPTRCPLRPPDFPGTATRAQPWHPEPLAGNDNQYAQLSAVIIKANTNADPTTRAVMFHLGNYIPQGVPDTFGFNGTDSSQRTGDTVVLTYPSGISG